MALSTPINFYTNNITIAEINVNSIVRQQRRHFLQSFITDNSIDILFACETKLTEKHKISFDNHNIIRNDRINSQFSGGTAIIINKKIKCEEINYPSSLNNKVLEYTIIKLSASGRNNLFLISAYATNAIHKRQIFIDELDRLFQVLKLNLPNNYYIILGDLNARHTSFGDSINNDRGRHLHYWERDNEGQFIINIIPPDDFSFINSRSFLDLCIADNRIIFNDLNNDCFNTKIYDSDHKAIVASENIAEIVDITLNLDEPIYIYKKTKWNKFSKYLTDNYTTVIPDNRNLSIEEIDSYIEDLAKTITDAIQHTVSKNGISGNINKYVNRGIKSLSKRKSKLLTILHGLLKTNNFGQNCYMISVFKILIKHTKVELEKVENHWQNIY